MAEAVACRAALYGFNSHPQLLSSVSYALPQIRCLNFEDSCLTLKKQD